MTVSFYIKKMFTFVSNVDSLDWKENATAQTICNRVTKRVKNGSIVLFHNDADHTPAALPNILKCLKDEGYEFVFIEDFILKELVKNNVPIVIDDDAHNVGELGYKFDNLSKFSSSALSPKTFSYLSLNF